MRKLTCVWMLCLLGGLFLLCSCAAPAQRAQHPNVLFIAIDDLNDWVGCLGGHPQAQTPNLDRLAAQGVLFTNAYCAAPACNPSRIALLSGIRSSTSGHYFNNQKWHRNSMLENSTRLPQHFRNNGYRAIGSGKIYHGGDPDPDAWDLYWPNKTKTKPNDPMPPKRNLNGLRKGHFDWGPIDASVSDMGDAKVADWIIEQLNAKHEQPVFLACGFFRPHLPWYVPQAYFDKFPLESIILPTVNPDDLDDVPAAGIRMAKPNGDHRAVIEHDQWKRAVQGYLASIAFMDDQLGRVIEAFEKRSDREDWIIVLWSDHGWHLGEKLHWRKFALWEEATHNVMLWVAPGLTRPGGRCSEAVNLVDIYPTLVDLCGLDELDQLEGVSLRPQLKDPSAERAEPVLTTYGYKNHSLRDRRWRYIRYANGGEELYDHAADANEWTNLAGDPAYADILNRMRQYLPKTDADPNPPR